MQFLDRVALDPRRIRRHLAISHQVAEREAYLPPGVEATVVYPPPGLDPGASPIPTPDGAVHLLSVGRLEAVKRHDLAIGAMAHVASPDVRLSVVGEGPERTRLEQLAAADSRITVAGALDDPALIQRYRDASAVIAVPEEEDLGYIALEAMLAGRPVVTCDDSGGIAELVGSDERGLITDPSPAALGSAIERLVGDAEAMSRLGTAGRTFADADHLGRGDLGDARPRSGRSAAVGSQHRHAQHLPRTRGTRRRIAAGQGHGRGAGRNRPGRTSSRSASRPNTSRR